MSWFPGSEIFRHRLGMALLGGLAFSALWALTEAEGLRDSAPGLFLLLIAGLSCWSAVSLAISGPVSLSRSMVGALVLAVPVAGLMRLAGLRALVPTDVLESPGVLAVFLLMVFVATPFLAVRLQGRGPWLSYPALFETAWAITIRFAAGMLFAGVVWGVLLLSDALLGIVGIDLIGGLLDIDGVPALVSGAALGLGIAVIHELREVVSPLLVLRLFRLLVWPVLIVVGVFLVAVPVQGLSGLVGSLSPAATLMGVALGAVTLITSAVGRADDEAMEAELGPRLLALAVPVVAGLAVLAVVLRVSQYGWTPDRVMAATVAGVTLLYGLAYGAAALRGAGRWRAPLRRANVVLALLVIAVCAAWLTPLLDAGRLSARSQVARFADGRSTLDQLPLDRMVRDWGKAGHDALDRLEAMTEHPDHDALVREIEAARRKPTLRQATTDAVDLDPIALARDLAQWVPVRPDGQLDPDALARVQLYWLSDWHVRCRPLEDGPPPCVFVHGRFVADLPAKDQGLLVLPYGPNQLLAQHLRWPTAEITTIETSDALPEDAVARILDGDFALAPVQTEALELGGQVFGPGLRQPE
ncbi:MAG: hypothetical protein CML68_19840 [Rhodobacteraceae bacterium]|nr:hypothetical protein [Paracoccaceae bacterium]